MAESSAMRRTVTGFLLLVLIVPASATRQPVHARHGMVVAMESIAADVGVSVLQKGGNAVDAAVAVGFALAVTHPFAGNIGGGGYMLIRLADRRATVIDLRARAGETGPNEFDGGGAARGFAAGMAKRGGLITRADLKAYKAVERTPLTGHYKGYTVIAAPPSSSGGVGVLEMMGILEGTGYEKGGP